jgi:hypothetical protein
MRRQDHRVARKMTRNAVSIGCGADLVPGASGERIRTVSPRGLRGPAQETGASWRPASGNGRTAFPDRPEPERSGAHAQRSNGPPSARTNTEVAGAACTGSAPRRSTALKTCAAPRRLQAIALRATSLDPKPIMRRGAGRLLFVAIRARCRLIGRSWLPSRSRFGGDADGVGPRPDLGNCPRVGQAAGLAPAPTHGPATTPCSPQASGAAARSRAPIQPLVLDASGIVDHIQPRSAPSGIGRSSDSRHGGGPAC